MIEVIAGPMFSGKTEELIRRLTRAKIANRKVIAYKPDIDDRFNKDILASHSGIMIECRNLSTQFDDTLIFPTQYDVVGIDEAQFFGYDIVLYARTLADRGIKVILSGLDMDYRKQPFGQMPTLLALADEVLKLKAVCHVCGEDAAYTQRLTSLGKPVSLKDPTILIGARDHYEARCSHCYEYAK